MILKSIIQSCIQFQAEATLLRAEQCEEKITMRQSELRLWEDGVRIHAPSEEATRYKAARSRDPGFTALCDAYKQLAARYREKRVLELQLVERCKQERVFARRIDSVMEEYKSIRTQEEGK